jgi:hypothetical protein
MATKTGRRSRQTRMLMACGALAAAVIAIGVSVAPASRKPNNGQATREYVTAYATRSHELHILSIDGRQRLSRFVTEVATGCHSVLVNAPRGTVGAGPIEVEISEALDLILTRAGAPAFAHFGHRVGQVQWAKSATNLRAQAVARANSSFANALPGIPKLCSDLTAWKERQFSGTPASTLKFDHEMTTPPVVPRESLEAQESALRRLLRQYESPEDYSLLHRARQFIDHTAVENFAALARYKTSLTNALYTTAGSM